MTAPDPKQIAAGLDGPLREALLGGRPTYRELFALNALELVHLDVEKGCSGIVSVRGTMLPLGTAVRAELEKGRA